jgi:hypothetical protein
MVNRLLHKIVPMRAKLLLTTNANSSPMAMMDGVNAIMALMLLKTVLLKASP